MSNQETTIKINVKADSAAVSALNMKLEGLAKTFERITRAAKEAAGAVDQVGGAKGKQGASPGSFSPPPIQPGYPSPATFARPPQGQTSSGLGGSAIALGSGIFRSVGGAALGVVGLGGLATIAKGLYGEKAYREQMDDLAKGLGDLSRDTLHFGNAWKAVGHDLGMGLEDISAAAKAYTELAGAVGDTGKALKEVRIASTFGRAYGLDPAQSARFFGSMRRLGAVGDNTTESLYGRTWRSPTLSAGDMAAMLASSISDGNMGGRIDELLESIEGLTRAQTQQLGKPVDMKGTVGMLTAFNNSGLPGLKGTFGAQVLGQLGQGIQNPGGGDYGQYLMYRWLGGGDWFKYKYKQEEGFSHSAEAIQGFKNTFGSLPPEMRYDYFAKIFKVSRHQAEGVLKSYGKLGGFNGYQELATRISGFEGQTGQTFDFRKIGLLTDLYRLKQSGTASPEAIGRLLDNSRVDLSPADLKEAKSDINRAIDLTLKASTVKTDAEQIKETGAKIEKSFSETGGKILNAVEKTAKYAEAIYNILPFKGKEEQEKRWADETKKIKPEDMPNAHNFREYFDRASKNLFGRDSVSKYDDLTNYWAAYYGVDPKWIKAMMKQESGGDPGATSRAGAQGLMQLMPGTWRDMGVNDPYDPNQNIMGGSKYFSELLWRAGGDYERATAMYNAGPNRKGLGNGHLPAETADYLKRVEVNYRRYGGGQVPPPSPVLDTQGGNSKQGEQKVEVNTTVNVNGQQVAQTTNQAVGTGSVNKNVNIIGAWY